MWCILSCLRDRYKFMTPVSVCRFTIVWLHLIWEGWDPGLYNSAVVSNSSTLLILKSCFFSGFVKDFCPPLFIFARLCKGDTWSLFQIVCLERNTLKWNRVTFFCPQAFVFARTIFKLWCSKGNTLEWNNALFILIHCEYNTTNAIIMHLYIILLVQDSTNSRWNFKHTSFLKNWLLQYHLL